MEENQIIFTTEDGEEIAFYILEETTIAGVNYLLVADSVEEEAEALILKEQAGSTEEETIYDVVEDEEELKAISKVFEELLDDIDITM
ncbi:MAG: hypothetical protein PWP24_1721 [Clostridiales bacterium]|nr:hypothetical protein [Clostridiales bacterium]